MVQVDAHGDDGHANGARGAGAHKEHWGLRFTNSWPTVQAESSASLPPRGERRHYRYRYRH